jgi:hypothetical protein
MMSSTVPGLAGNFARYQCLHQIPLPVTKVRAEYQMSPVPLDVQRRGSAPFGSCQLSTTNRFLDTLIAGTCTILFCFLHD